MKIEIYVFNKEKQESFYNKAIEEYAKRLTRYCPVSHKVIRKEKEWIKRLEQGKEGYLVIAGESISSETFSERLKEWEVSGKKNVTFYIMREEESAEWIAQYKEVFAETFSLSNYQMSPMLKTVILYEQIYRGYRIMHNHPYHK